MTVAKENLLAAINTANEKLAQTDAYTPASLEALRNAVDEAQTVYNKAMQLRQKLTMQKQM